MIFPKLLGLAAVLFLISFLAVEMAQAKESASIHVKRLKNGLTAIVKESHRAPVVAVQIWVRAGSTFETEEQAGITHLIEHMIFKGTEKRPAGELARTIESLGGTINAYTSYDYTVYHCVVPKAHLDTALDVLEDAVFHSTFDPDELEREKEVVLEEMRMRNDRPQTVLYEDLMKISYQKLPYRRPIIGYEETVKSFTRQDILKYMADRYRPAHMAVVVTGDVKAGEAISKIDEIFSREPKEPAVKMAFDKEPRQKEVRLSIKHMDCQQAYIALSFSGLPGFHHPDTPVLDVLGAIASEGESSRLVRSLKNRKQLVSRISAYAFTPAGPGLFEVSATLEPEKLEKALEEIFYQLFKIKFYGISDQELEKAKTQVATSFIYEQETMEGEARKLGVFHMLTGDAEGAAKYLEQVRAITPEQVRKVTERYLAETNVNLSVLLPEGVETALTLQGLKSVIADGAERALGLDMLEGSAEKSPVKRFKLSNGTTVLALEAHEVPSVAVKVVFPGGLRYETAETNGLFNMLAKAWNKGTAARSAEAIAETVDAMGASLSGFSGQNTFGLQSRFTSDQFSKGLALLTEVLLSPTFPQDEIDKLKPIILAQLRQQQDNMPTVAVQEFKKLLFSPHPYSMNPLGRAEVINRLSTEDLRRCWREYAVPQRGVISVVGDFDTAELKSALERLTRGWTWSGSSVAPSPPAPEPLTKPRLQTVIRDKEQEHIILGFPGPAIDSEERFAMEVLNAVLAGQGGRLFTTLRDKESLAYSVTSFMTPGIDYGLFACYIACAPQKKKEAQSGLWRELYSVRENLISAQELERAKNWLVGRYQIGLQTHSSKALELALDEIYGLGIDFPEKYEQKIMAVTPEMVRQAARKFIDPEAYVLVVVGP